MNHSAQRGKDSQTRVLVLDWADALGDMPLDVLAGAGYAVSTADTTVAGLQAFLQHDVDVLIASVDSTRAAALPFLSELLTLCPWLGALVIADRLSDESAAALRELGACTIVEPPVKPGILLATLQSETRRVQAAVQEMPVEAPDHVLYRQGLLRRLTGAVIDADNTGIALCHLARELNRLVDGAMVGLLGVDDQERVLVLASELPVPTQLLTQLESEILERYHSLTGRSLSPESLALRVEADVAADAEQGALGALLHVPLVAGGQVRGVAALGALNAGSFAPSDVTLFLHATGHVAMILAAFSRMRELTVRDSLTGLFTRRHLEDQLERVWAAARENESETAVVIVDIDHFKLVNDSYGHLVGDQVLREFAQLLLDHVRESDVTCRYGGDELVAILPGTPVSEARDLAERIVSGIRDHTFYADENPLRLTVSAGVASCVSARSPKSSVDLLAQADQALYVAKRGGRDRVCVFQRHLLAAVEPSGVREPEPAPVSSHNQAAGATAKGTVMVVDDEPSIGHLLKRFLEIGGYEAFVACSADEALAEIQACPGKYDVAFTDINMPGKTGFELLDEMSSLDDTIVKIIITGYATVDNAVIGMRKRAYDFLPKPIDHSHFFNTLERALEFRRLLLENVSYQLQLKAMVRQKSAELSRSLDQVKESYEFTLEALVSMLDAREQTSGQHSKRVSNLAVILAREVGLEEVNVLRIKHGALLHDIGKIGIPDAILLKPGPLDAGERRVINTHSQIGYDILSSSSYLDEVAEIVLSHQERFDGTGYPRGLGGDEICLGARIFAVLDTYDAIRSKRVYHSEYTHEEAVAEIRRHSGTQFDPEVVKAFLKCQADINANWYGAAEDSTQP